MNYFSKNKGFTLIELLVVVSIAVVITTSVVVQQRSWSDSLAVKTQAYDLALMIRQAQVYSLGVKEDTVGTGDKFNIGYGVYFDTDNTRYIYFADRNNNNQYDNGEQVETKTFNNGVLIKDVCGVSKCIYSGGGLLQKASISFFRPETNANISLLNNVGNPIDNSPVTISLESPNGIIVNVIVEANGQISIQ